MNTWSLVGTPKQAYCLLHIPAIVCVVVTGIMGDRLYWRNIRKRVDYAHLPQEIRENKIGFLSIHKECKGTSIWLGALPMWFWLKLLNKVYEIGFVMIGYLMVRY